MTSLFRKTIMIREKEPEDYNRDPYEVAKERGLKVVLVPDQFLALDIDTDSNFFNERIAFAYECELVELSTLEVTSAGGKGKHLYLKLKRDCSEIVRIALQAALGSDYKREVFCICRNLQPAPTQPNLVMFETKVNAFIVENWIKAQLNSEPTPVLTESDTPF